MAVSLKSDLSPGWGGGGGIYSSTSPAEVGRA